MSIILDNVSYMDKIKEFSYSFKENEITFIMGSSNSGKTLISYLIMGLLRLDGGSIKVNDNIINKRTKNFFKIRKNIGYVFQKPSLEFFCKNCYEELIFSLKRYNKTKMFYDKRVKDCLDLVGLSCDYLDVNPFSLSSGEQVKLAIAISLMHDPDNLIFDDITVNLDNKTKRLLIKLLLKLKNEYNKTIIIISNDIDFILSFSSNIILLDKGIIKLDIKKDEFIKNIDVLRNSGINLPKIIDFINTYNDKKNKQIKYTLDYKALVDYIINE